MNLLLLKYVDRSLGRCVELLLRCVRGGLEIVRPPLPRLDVRRILVVKLWGIGNIVMILPILDGIKQRYPDAKLYMLTLDMNRELLQNHASLDGVFTIKMRSAAEMLLSCLSVLRMMRKVGIDVLLDMEQFSRLSAVFGCLSGAKHMVGLFSREGSRGHLYNVKVPFNPNQHMRMTFADVARAIGVDPPPLAGSGLTVSGTGRDELRNLLADTVRETDVIVGFHIGSSDNFAGKRWPKENFARVADAIIEEYGVKVAFTGSANEIALVSKAIGFMRHEAIDLAGKLSILGLVATVARCRLLFSNDTAPVHIATALGIPVVAFYGPATPEIYGPTGNESLVFYKGLPCSPCITNFNAKTSFCRIPVCIESITVEEVIAAVRARYGRHLSSAP